MMLPSLPTLAPIHIDLAALRSAAEEFFETEVNNMYEWAQGSRHKLFLLELDSAHDDDLPSEVLARVMTAPRLQRSVDSEVATINFIAENTTIPVARVYYHNSSPENPVGAQFMFQARLYGEPLRKALDDDDDEPEYELSLDAWHQLVLDYAAVVSQLFHLRFDRIGALYETVIYPDDGTGPQLQTFVGPSAESWFYRGQRGLLEHLDVGPWDSSSDWLAGLVSNEVRYLRTYPVELEDELEDEIRKTSEAKHGDIDILHTLHGAEERLRRLISLCNLASGELGPDEKLIKCVRTYGFLHADLLPNNILVDMRTGRIKGIIGWEDASVAPVWRLASIPYWLEWPDDPGSEWSRPTIEKTKGLANDDIVRNGVTKAEIKELANVFLEAVAMEDPEQLFLLCLQKGITDKVKILPHLLYHIWERGEVELALEDLETWEQQAFGGL